MKVEINKQEEKFTPIKIEITLESKEEAVAFMCQFNIDSDTIGKVKVEPFEYPKTGNYGYKFWCNIGSRIEKILAN